jgi:hypothetical protein
MSEPLQGRFDRTLTFHRERLLGDEGTAEKTINDQYLKRKRKAERFPSVPMMMRHLPPGSLDPKARKDSLIHAHAVPRE